jgi:hypothetical protein
VRLGNPNEAPALRCIRKGNKASVMVIRAKTDQHAENLQPVLEDRAQQGIISLGGIAVALRERDMRAPRGGSGTNPPYATCWCVSRACQKSMRLRLRLRR